MTDDQLRKDPIVAKALALEYVSLDDLKSTERLHLAKVLQRHAALALAGIHPVRATPRRHESSQRLSPKLLPLARPGLRNCKRSPSEQRRQLLGHSRCGGS